MAIANVSWEAIANVLRQKVRSSRPLEAKVALSGAPEVPKRMSEDSLRQPLGSPRDAFGSIFGIKMVPKSELDDFEEL